MVQIFNLSSQGIFSLSVNKGRYGRVARDQVSRDATFITDQGIIYRLFNLLDIVQILVGDGLLG